jgi:DNA-binding LytR/AlgR family response regulator
MTSRLITPPDQLLEFNPCLIVNAQDNQFESLYMYLAASDEHKDIHLYHSGMDELEWVMSLVHQVDLILVNRDFESMLNQKLVTELKQVSEKVHYFGQLENYKTPVDYFLNSNHCDK